MHGPQNVLIQILQYREVTKFRGTWWGILSIFIKRVTFLHMQNTMVLFFGAVLKTAFWWVSEHQFGPAKQGEKLGGAVTRISLPDEDSGRFCRLCYL